MSQLEGSNTYDRGLLDGIFTPFDIESCSCQGPLLITLRFKDIPSEEYMKSAEGMIEKVVDACRSNNRTGKLQIAPSFGVGIEDDGLVSQRANAFVFTEYGKLPSGTLVVYPAATWIMPISNPDRPYRSGGQFCNLHKHTDDMPECLIDASGSRKRDRLHDDLHEQAHKRFNQTYNPIDVFGFAAPSRYHWGLIDQFHKFEELWVEVQTVFGMGVEKYKTYKRATKADRKRVWGSVSRLFEGQTGSKQAKQVYNYYVWEHKYRFTNEITHEFQDHMLKPCLYLETDECMKALEDMGSQLIGYFDWIKSTGDNQKREERTKQFIDDCYTRYFTINGRSPFMLCI